MAKKSKRVPQRTCVACGQTRGKKDLIRLVRAGNGGIDIDIAATKPGRGAYLCPQEKCWNLALKKNRLEHALRTKLSSENLRILVQHDDDTLWKD
jgi:predicted RNA-binding protein YlxR (DUF448 family)